MHSSLKDPFYPSIEYSPTEKASIDRISSNARRQLLPHILILQMLFSRFQSARYHKPGLVMLLLRLVLRTVSKHQQMGYARKIQFIR